MIRLAFDLIFAGAIALAIAYGLAAVLREYTAVTWWQVLIAAVAVWVLGTVAWWLNGWALRQLKDG